MNLALRSLILNGSQLTRIVITSIIIGIGCVLGLMTLSYISLGLPEEPQRVRIVQSLSAGDLNNNPWNDCLILFQTINRNAPRGELAISPLMPPSNYKHPCDALRASIASPDVGAPSFYHQYLHGHTTLARFLLSKLSVAQIKKLFSVAIAIIMLSSIIVSLISIARRGIQRTNMLWLIIFFVFSRWFGLEIFAMKLDQGPATLCLFGFMAILACGSGGLGLHQKYVVALAGIFAALTATFEFLTGGIPLGLAVLIGGLAISLRVNATEKPELALLQSVEIGAITFVCTLVMCFLAKLVIVDQIFGHNNLLLIANQLLFRMGFTAGEAVGGTAHDPSYGFTDMVVSVVWHLDSLAENSRLLVLGMLLISVVSGIWGLRVTMRDGMALDRMRAILLAGSNIVVVVWPLLMSQHMAQHAVFMDRIFVWPIASGFALFAFGVMVEKASLSDSRDGSLSESATA